MSVICLQIGQCGIQVGDSIFKFLEKEQVVLGICLISFYRNGPSNQRLLYPLCLNKQLLVDTEKKTTQKRSTKSLFQPSIVQIDSSGRGNNWAHGYSDLKGLEVIHEQFRKAAEKEIRLDGTLLIHSVAGGTGSGCGSLVLQDIRDFYPKQFIISCPVLPFELGETSVQHYNATLSMAHMQRHADMILTFSNDELLSIIKKQKEFLKEKNCQIRLDELNEYIAHGLLGLLLPNTGVNFDSKKLFIGQTKPFDGWDLIESVTPIPSMKFSKVYSSRLLSSQESNKYEATASWNDTKLTFFGNLLKPMQKSNCLSAKVCFRGVQDADFFLKEEPLILQKLKQRIGEPCMQSQFDCMHSYYQGLNLKSRMKSMTLCTNTSNCTNFIDQMINKATQKLQVGAFLHWYERYHPDIRQELMDACETLNMVSTAYQTL